MVFERDRPAFVDAGVIRTQGGEFNDRLEEIFRGVGELMTRLQPDAVAIEKVFVNRNVDSALKLGAARSAAICATFEHETVLAEYTPREIKQAVTGTGGATKDQVQHMVKALLGVSGRLSSDASDALAIAICHGNSAHLKQRLTLMTSRR